MHVLSRLRASLLVLSISCMAYSFNPDATSRLIALYEKDPDDPVPVDLEVLAQTLSDKADPNASYEGYGARIPVLCLAVKSRQVEAVSLLLANGADPDAWSGGLDDKWKRRRRSALFFAILPHNCDVHPSTMSPTGQREMVQILIKAKADLHHPYLIGPRTYTPLQLAVVSGQPDIVEELLLSGADLASAEKLEPTHILQPEKSSIHHRERVAADLAKLQSDPAKWKPFAERADQTLKILDYYRKAPQVRAEIQTALTPSMNDPLARLVGEFLLGPERSSKSEGAGVTPRVGPREERKEMGTAKAGDSLVGEEVD